MTIKQLLSRIDVAETRTDETKHIGVIRYNDRAAIPALIEAAAKAGTIAPNRGLLVVPVVLDVDAWEVQARSYFAQRVQETLRDQWQASHGSSQATDHSSAGRVGAVAAQRADSPRAPPAAPVPDTWASGGFPDAAYALLVHQDEGWMLNSYHSTEGSAEVRRDELRLRGKTCCVVPTQRTFAVHEMMRG